MDPSGIRFGTPAITTRGFKEKECEQVATLMIDALENRTNEAGLGAIREEVRVLAKQFPIPEAFV
jgi:glycine hydroxymethyltransferase